MDTMNDSKIRLQKYLAMAGVASRRKSEEMIAAGRISVNGQTITKLGTKIIPDKDQVAVDGKNIHVKSGKPGKSGVTGVMGTTGTVGMTGMVYILLHKPEGVITSVSDPQKRPVVMDFVRDIAGDTRIFPVGRLDYDSSGLILMTNDGQLTQKLTHPSNLIPKTYIALLRGVPSKSDLLAFKEGLIVDNQKTAPAKIKIIKKPLANKTNNTNKANCTAQITIHEGKNRQVRKMCEAIGCPVLQLKRVAMGPLKLGNLPRGKARRLTQEEVSQLEKLQ